ncbi:hypothetical protein DLJ53_11075 [Acuticoccus sediminis]|uniref:AB hydrolase-1 domain-containing protein n=1 Tax=Acuticoccus sediminis TaxID=2184697 RepID=A0A8B2NPW1_9HYPH|nr:alpha/beta hydrolase [Acuticoccus sediminis]RAI01925.1 hypothetical protein DLJ53_11075 [Acuticoccus sediminis]
MPTTHVNGRLIHYREWGEGETNVIFVHGGFGSSANLWARTAAALPPGVRALAADMFLHSDPPPKGHSVEGIADHLADFALAMGAAPATFVGHSMGGVVCQLIGARRPEVVRQLVLVTTGPNVRNHGVALMLMDQLRERGRTRENMDEIARHWFKTIPDREAFERYVDDSMEAPLEAMLSVQQSLIDMDTTPELARITAPVLVTHGVHDHGRTMDHAERLMAGIPDARLALFEESGHAPMWEEAPKFNETLHAFLRQPAA